jgi:hypothetical protein
MSKALHSSIEALASDFARAVLSALRSASLEEILAESRGGAAPRGRGGRKSAAVTDDVAPKASRGGRKAGPGKKRGKKGRLPRRSLGDIQKVLESIVGLLQKNPEGLRAEQIRSQLGLLAKEMPRPLAEGLAGKRLRKKGEKRATTYFAAGRKK